VQSQAAAARKAARVANFGRELMRQVEKSLLLQIFDAVWKEGLSRGASFLR
jgi:preprotein translocase subunit SecA